VQTPLEMPKLNFSVIELELNKIVILLYSELKISHCHKRIFPFVDYKILCI
jgi:protein-disulfide isomerase